MPKRAEPAPPERRAGVVIPGTVELLILKAVSRGRSHGYAIAEWIHATSAETVLIEEGALYPALHRLELRGMLEAEWALSDTKRRVKMYRLTSYGRRHLADEGAEWTRIAAATTRVLENG